MQRVFAGDRIDRKPGFASPQTTFRVDLMKSQFDKHRFWNEIKHIKKEYGIKISKKPHARSAKRITILTSTAFLRSNGSVHWVQCLESALYRHCKAKKLDCEKLAMEDNTRSYICRKKSNGGKPHKDYGKKLYSNEFLDWSICVNATTTPEVELFANIITDHLALEEIYDDDEQELSGSSKRERGIRNSRHKEGRFKKIKEARLTLR
jgi:hypothetical protein